MKAYIFATTLILLAVPLCAQDYKLNKSSGKLDISEVNRVTIEGYNGNEIIFSTRDHKKESDDRAKGLRSISSMGIEDNTGLGLSVVDNGGTVEVRQLKKMGGPDITIKVPKGVSVSLSHTSPHGSGIEIRNYEGNLDVSTIHNHVELSNVTGEIKVSTVHGDVDALFDTAPGADVSIESVHGHVDVALPQTIKANVKLSTSFGEILVDPDLKIEIDRSGDMVKYSDKVSGKINGGGNDVNLMATHNNVYLRKK
jgi:hypothetical protein